MWCIICFHTTCEECLNDEVCSSCNLKKESKACFYCRNSNCNYCKTCTKLFCHNCMSIDMICKFCENEKNLCELCNIIIETSNVKTCSSCLNKFCDNCFNDIRCIIHCEQCNYTFCLLCIQDRSVHINCNFKENYTCSSCCYIVSKENIIKCKHCNKQFCILCNGKLQSINNLYTCSDCDLVVGASTLKI